MGNGVLAYTGGAMGETEAEQQAAMKQWMTRLAALGESVQGVSGALGRRLGRGLRGGAGRVGAATKGGRVI